MFLWFLWQLPSGWPDICIHKELNNSHTHVQQLRVVPHDAQKRIRITLRHIRNRRTETPRLPVANLLDDSWEWLFLKRQEESLLKEHERCLTKEALKRLKGHALPTGSRLQETSSGRVADQDNNWQKAHTAQHETEQTENIHFIPTAAGRLRLCLTAL